MNGDISLCIFLEGTFNSFLYKQAGFVHISPFNSHVIAFLCSFCWLNMDHQMDFFILSISNPNSNLIEWHIAVVNEGIKMAQPHVKWSDLWIFTLYCIFFMKLNMFVWSQLLAFLYLLSPEYASSDSDPLDSKFTWFRM